MSIGGFDSRPRRLYIRPNPDPAPATLKIDVPLEQAVKTALAK